MNTAKKSSLENESMEQCQSSTNPAGTSQEQPPSKAAEILSQRTSTKPFSPVLEHYVNKRFEWKIDGCSKLVSPDKGEKAEKNYHFSSPSFRFMNRLWYLNFYPNLPNMVVCLMLSGGASGPPTRLHQAFGLKNVEGKTEWRLDAIGNFGSGAQNLLKRKGQTFLNKEELTERASHLVKDDSIVIVCVLTTLESVRFIREFTCSVEWYERIEQERQVKRDMLFKIKGTYIYVDLDIIRLSSPLLATHVVTGALNDNDYSPVVIFGLLLYPELGTVFDISVDEAMQLYELAVTYQIEGLRERCLAYLTFCTLPHTVLKVIDFAEKRPEPELLQLAIKYLVSHAQLVVATKEWVQLVEKDPERANQFYRRIAGRLTAAGCPVKETARS